MSSIAEDFKTGLSVCTIRGKRYAFDIANPVCGVVKYDVVNRTVVPVTAIGCQKNLSVPLGSTLANGSVGSSRNVLEIFSKGVLPNRTLKAT